MGLGYCHYKKVKSSQQGDIGVYDSVPLDAFVGGLVRNCCQGYCDYITCIFCKKFCKKLNFVVDRPCYFFLDIR